MYTPWESFILTFVPLFIVIDALGIVPFLTVMSDGMSRQEQRKTINISVFTAAIVGLAFLFFGRAVLNVMNISVESFAIAGGIILLVLSIKYMTTGHWVDAVKEEMIAVVPLGTPLLAGPATITTLLLLYTEFPLYMILIAYLVNMLLCWLIFLAGNRIMRFFGQGGLKAVSKVFSLLLSAIAVSMVIKGLMMLGVI
ncbi:MAG: MarC family protein [Dehalococcoidia bacterium]|jgi:multiple antibiotic resistance protein